MWQSLYNFGNRHSLLIGIVWLSILFVAFFPPKFVNIDEHDYLQNAQLIVTGELRQTCDGSPSQFVTSQGFCISKYNLGTSLFLIPAALTSPAAGFVVAFAVFIIGIITFHKLLQLLRVSTIFTLLYALFPAFVYYSRTLMSETFSATLIMLVVYFLWQEQIIPSIKWGVFAGITAGLAVLVRYTNVIPIALIFLVLYLPALRRRNLKDILVHLAGVLLGGLPWLLAFVVINSYLYGGALHSGYALSGEEGVFLWQQVPLFLARYAGGLSLIYPLMLELPLVIRTRLTGLLLPVIATIVFFAGFPNTTFESRPLDLIVGFRFLLPVIPLLLLMYAVSLHRLEEKKLVKPFVVILILGLLAVSFLLSYQHQQFLLGL